MKLFLFLSLFLYVTGSVLAQDLSIRAYVSDNTVTLDGQIQYSVEVSGRAASVPAPQYPDFSDFYVLSGPNTSTSIQLVNGAMTSSKTFSFYLKPRKKGSLVIGKASAEVDGKRIETEALTITVSDAVQPAPSAADKKPKETRDDEIAGEDLFLKAVVSDRNIYIGEQIVVEYKLYFKVNVRGYDFQKLPSNAGFWAEEIKMPAQPPIQNEIVNGVNYNVAVLKKYALFPTQTGQLTIEPMQVNLEALVRSRRQRRSIFDSFFDDPFGNTVQKTVMSRPIAVTVNPLPETGKPSDFRGAVGRYQMSVETDKQEALVNEAISLKIRLSGSGNIKILDLPSPQIPPDIEQYEPKISSNINTDNEIIRGSKTAEYILIPRLPGDYVIKPVTLSFYDPALKQYKSLSSQPVTLTVTGEVKSALGGGGQNVFSRQEVALLGQDIRFIKEQAHFMRMGYKAYLSLPFWIGLFSAIVLFGVFVVYNDYTARISGDAVMARSKKAGKIAAKMLRGAGHLIESESSAEFYRAVSIALQGFVQDKLNISLSDFSVQTVHKALSEREIDAVLVQDYLKVYEECEYRQFANIKATSNERKEHYENARNVLTRLEKWI